MIQHFSGAGLGQAQPRRTRSPARPRCPFSRGTCRPQRSAPLCGLGPVRPPSSGAGGRRVLRPSCRRPPAGRGEEGEEEECEGHSGAQDCAIGPGAIERPRRPGAGRIGPGSAQGGGAEGTEGRPGALRGSAASGAMSGSALGGQLGALAQRCPTKNSHKRSLLVMLCERSSAGTARICTWL